MLDEIERTEHLPFHVEHIVPEVNTDDTLTSGYVQVGPTDTETHKEEQVPFESILISDVDGHASANVLQATAIQHFKNPEKGYLEMPHAPMAVGICLIYWNNPPMPIA